jgi:hypothetical protein
MSRNIITYLLLFGFILGSGQFVFGQLLHAAGTQTETTPDVPPLERRPADISTQTTPAVPPAETTPAGTPTVVATTTQNSAVIEKLNCIRNAVEKREDAIRAAFDKKSSSLKGALETRKAALLEAWSIPDPKKRVNTIRTVWGEYQTKVAAAQSAYQKEVTKAWTTFRKERVDCEKLSKVRIQETPEPMGSDTRL